MVKQKIGYYTNDILSCCKKESFNEGFKLWPLMPCFQYSSAFYLMHTEERMAQKTRTLHLLCLLPIFICFCLVFFLLETVNNVLQHFVSMATASTATYRWQIWNVALLYQQYSLVKKRSTLDRKLPIPDPKIFRSANTDPIQYLITIMLWLCSYLEWMTTAIHYCTSILCGIR